MAISDSKSFSYYGFESGEGDYDNTNDVFKWVIIEEGYSTIDSNAVNPTLSDFTQVASSGNYVANETIANTTWLVSGDTSTLDGDGWVFAADGANPTSGRTILLYNDTSADKSALALVDLTTDGGVGSPVDTTQGLTYNIPVTGIYEVVRTK